MRNEKKKTCGTVARLRLEPQLSLLWLDALTVVVMFDLVEEVVVAVV
jgi:hypothetical protein